MNYRHDFQFTGDVDCCIPAHYVYRCVKCNKEYLSIIKEQHDKYKNDNDMLNKINDKIMKRLGLNRKPCK